MPLAATNPVTLSQPTNSTRAIAVRTHGRRIGPVTRLVSPTDIGQLIKPFVFLDGIAFDGIDPDTIPDIGKGFGWHPHSGIATVSLLFDGTIFAVDSTADLESGAVDWLMAGGGAWHGGKVLEPVGGYQLWVAMPPELENARARSRISSKTKTSAPEANKAIALRLAEVFNDRRLDLLEDVLHPEFRGRGFSAFPPSSPEVGPGARRKLYEMFYQGIPDARAEVLDVVAEGDKVVILDRFFATLQGEFFGCPGTGDRIEWMAIHIYTIRDRKIVEDTVMTGALAIVQQLGLTASFTKPSE